MFKEFREFALGGSLMDMAIGIIMGGAIGALVGSMIENLINPIVGLFMGGQDLSSLTMKIGEGMQMVDGVETPVPLMLNYGAFIGALINFLILAFVIFMLARMINNAKKKMGMPMPGDGPTDIDLLTEIRDSLKR